jgi:hypothetical protein
MPLEVAPYVQPSTLVGPDGVQSEGVNKVAVYFWDNSAGEWAKATTGSPVANNVNVNNFPSTYPVTAAALPLPTGAATEATLATLAKDSTVAKDTTVVARLGTLGQKNMAGSTPVVISSDQAHFPVTLTGKNLLNPAAYVDVLVSPDGGLLVNQNIQIDAANSSTSNLAAGATFTGGTTSNISASMIQIFLKADQNCDVFLDQSQDGTNFDISDKFNFYAAVGNFGINVGAFGAYFRVRVTNTGASTTTYFRLQTIFVPIANQLPRALDANGNLKVGVQSISDDSGFLQHLSPYGDLVSVPKYRLIGSIFTNTAVDTNFWTPVTGTGGTVTESGGILTIGTGTTANNAVSIQSTAVARFVAGQANRFSIDMHLNDTGVANNTRRGGCFTTNDGMFFQLSGTTFSLVTRIGGVDTPVNNGSFNGRFGSTFTLDTAHHRFHIEFTATTIYWFVDDNLIHTTFTATSPLMATMHHPIRIENFNTGGSTTDVSFDVHAAYITRLGIPQTQPVARNLAGANSVTLKTSPGTLHGVVINSNTGTSITLYDNTAASGTKIATINPNQVVTLDYKGIAFSTGLTVVTVGSTIDCTILLE